MCRATSSHNIGRSSSPMCSRNCRISMRRGSEDWGSCGRSSRLGRSCATSASHKRVDQRFLITPADARLWRLRYKVRGRESMLGLGSYPATSLKAARARRAERASGSNTFEAIAREWLAKQPFAPKTLKKAVWTFEDLLFPYIGSRPVCALTAPELLGVFRRLERCGKHKPRAGRSNEFTPRLA